MWSVDRQLQTHTQSLICFPCFEVVIDPHIYSLTNVPAGLFWFSLHNIKKAGGVADLAFKQRHIATFIV